MDFDLIINKIGHVYGYCIIISLCVYFPQFYIKAERKDKTTPAESHEKIGIWISSILLISFISFIYAYNRQDRISEFVAAFIILFIPVAFSIFWGFTKDKNLNVKERRKINKEIEDLGTTEL